MARPIQTTGTKTCKKCGVTKDITEFYKRGGKQSPNSRKNHCKVCEIKRLADSYDPVKYREQHLQRRYNLTQDEFDRMLTEQNHSCAICGTTKPGGRGVFVVDHDHKTGKVRGLLCKRCNVGVGEFKDDPVIIRSAVAYLQK